MSTFQVLDASDPDTALRIARTLVGKGHRQKFDKPAVALVTSDPEIDVSNPGQPKATVSGPKLAIIDLQYDVECRGALRPLLQDLLSQFESAGWSRGKVAYEMMNFGAASIKSAR